MPSELGRASVRITRCETMTAVESALAELVRSETDADLLTRGGSTIVLSGGNTPRRYLGAIVACRKSWRNVAITLSDERFVPLDDHESNEAMVRHFFRGSGARIIGLRGQAATPPAAAAAAAVRLGNSCAWPAAISILGFGLDGHFASLFTDADCSAGQGDLCIATQSPATGADRISMTFDRIQETRKIIIVCDTAKFAYLDHATSAGLPTPPPIVRLLQQAGDRTEILVASE